MYRTAINFNRIKDSLSLATFELIIISEIFSGINFHPMHVVMVAIGSVVTIINTGQRIRGINFAHESRGPKRQ